MNKMKDQIKSIWEVTNLGDPAKIIGIEIAISENYFTGKIHWKNL